MDIKAFIRELLFGHDCVIVPGFGGFIGNYTAARLDKGSATFFPPVKQISFNRNLNHNDGLLIGRISESAGINYGDARSIVEEFAAELRSKLEKGEKVVFDHIGSFENNGEGNIQFEPDRNANYHLDSYGLEPFQCMPLEGYDVRKRVFTHIDKEPLKRIAVRKILWRAAVIIPLVAALVVVQLRTDLFRSKIESTTMNPLVAAEFENNRQAVEDEIAASAVIPEVTLTEPADDLPTVDSYNPVPAEVVPPANISATYVLVTGSFKSEENALSQVKQLKADGFDPEIFQAENGFFRVSAMECNDIATATFKRDSLLKKFPGAWVSKRK